MMQNRSCAICHAANRISPEAVECRKNPPQMLALPTPHPLTGQMAISVQGVFPQMANEAWCAQFKLTDAPQSALVKPLKASND